MSILDGQAYVKKNMQPELTTSMKMIINECWKIDKIKEQGKAKISADGVFSRHEEMEKQKTIRLSELSLSSAWYQTIGQINGCQRGRPQSEGSIDTKQMKVSVSN